MSLFHNQKHLKVHKKRLNQEQIKLLEANFNANKKLEPERKFDLARELGVPPRQIAIWYQNKRARWRNQSLEMDHGAIQLKLESAVSEKKQLEEEVRNLKAELKMAHDLLEKSRFSSQARAREYYACSSHVPPVSSLSSYCDESSPNDDVGFSGNNHNYNYWCCEGDIGASMRYEELYGSMVFGSKGLNFGVSTDERYLNCPQKW